MIFIYKTIIALLFGIKCIQNQAIDGDGYCTNNKVVKTSNGTFYIEKRFCCRNYEEQNEECKECKIGYTSTSGEQCQPCKGGMYGKRCAFSCKCQENERCDHIKGCIGFEESFTSFKSTTPKNKANSLVKGFNLREIIVYSVCAVAFVFVILLCGICQRRYTHISRNFKKYQTESKRGQNKPELSFPNIPSEGIAGRYEVIDESNMIENIANVNGNSGKDTNESSCEPDRKDYITPYQATGENSNHDNHEISATTQPNHRIINDHVFTDENNDSGSSGSDKQMRISGSSGSETDTKIAGHLNPYQPIIISARDSHEYKSLNNWSDDLRLSSSDSSIDLK